MAARFWLHKKALHLTTWPRGGARMRERLQGHTACCTANGSSPRVSNILEENPTSQLKKPHSTNRRDADACATQSKGTNQPNFALPNYHRGMSVEGGRLKIRHGSWWWTRVVDVRYRPSEFKIRFNNQLSCALLFLNSKARKLEAPCGRIILVVARNVWMEIVPTSRIGIGTL